MMGGMRREKDLEPPALPPPATYRAVFQLPGFKRMAASALLARTAAQMSALVLVLFVLGRFRSPQLAGLAVLCSILPGLVLSPVAGALLDRGARVRLIILDYAIGAGATTLLAVLATSGHLAAPVLLAIVAVGSLTQPLSNAGLRSVLPLMAPRHLWDRVNAIDSGTYLVATVMGPGLGGAAVALLGATRALLAPAAALFGAAILLTGLVVPEFVRPTTPMLRDAWDGLAYVMRNRALRMLAIMISVFNLGGGALTVALPVLVLRRLHAGSGETGAMFAVMGAAGIVSGLLVGRVDTEGREHVLLAAGALISATALGLLAFAGSAGAVAVAMAVIGLGNGPLDLGLFSLRQRATGPEWFGRAFAVSMSLNYLGIPIGAAVAGLLVARSITATLVAATAIVLVSAAIPMVSRSKPR